MKFAASLEMGHFSGFASLTQAWGDSQAQGGLHKALGSRGSYEGKFERACQSSVRSFLNCLREPGEGHLGQKEQREPKPSPQD